MVANLISFDVFNSIDLRSGTIVDAQPFPKAIKPAFKVWVDFGAKLGILQTSAQITHHYDTESLPGKRVIGCVNLGEKNIAGFVSQFLLLGFADTEGKILLATAESAVPNGQKLH